ncbi:RpiB/LacA/LacB family sugar-phosphate isomerase [Prolixibacter sp. NT017]|uniref:RpiB/LacA/LacB family sugar-phosphate isomerase n=1 Tax=Prolixibacter sp. NT017 TaxID=2652390 RepID=UPI001287132C|nr:RpiB/LacA/LacB family sugar-phosphate isomerase [Prolixibacter sp. NT017]GET24383.1 hypothetical protein NT017_07120 [Prolixibacter sp. NT017]
MTVVEFGNLNYDPNDDFPDYVIPLSNAIVNKSIDRGIAICGSGVGASIAANKIHGTRAGLIHDCFSARQGVEDDDMNILCLGGRVIGGEAAWEITKTFLNAKFSSIERHKRRLDKIYLVENHFFG